MGTIPFSDWLSICEGKAKYCRLLDSKDWAGFAALVTDDFEMDISDGSDVPPFKGRDAALEMIRSSIETAKTAHHVHSPEMTLESPSRVKVIWAMQDRVVFNEQLSVIGYGNYHEVWVRQDDQWKLASLKLTRFMLDVQGG